MGTRCRNRSQIQNVFQANAVGGGLGCASGIRGIWLLQLIAILSFPHEAKENTMEKHSGESSDGAQLKELILHL